MTWIPLPIGVENFEDLRRNGYYFVDKTLFIKELLDMKGKVNLFTRPRRFGKTLNMSMLRYFFETGKADNSELFQGLKIMDEGEKYLIHMGQYPVISISLKSMKQPVYEDAFYSLQEELAGEFKRHDELLSRLPYEADREKYLRFIGRKAEPKEYLGSLKFLSESPATVPMPEHEGLPFRLRRSHRHRAHQRGHGLSGFKLRHFIARLDLGTDLRQIHALSIKPKTAASSRPDSHDAATCAGISRLSYWPFSTTRA